MSEQTGRGRNMRLILLVAVLFVMLFALWYEYKVARPSVTTANETIIALNRKINAAGNNTAMTSKEVQEALNRQPSRTYQDGAYTVEVYSWVSGLPFRTHDWFAFYTPNAGQLVFNFCHPFEVPPGGIAKAAPIPQSEDGEESEDEVTEHDLPGPPGPPMMRQVGPEPKRPPGGDDASGAQEPSQPDAQPEEEADTPADESPTAEEDTQEKPTADQAEVSQPEEIEPVVEDPAETAPSAGVSDPGEDEAESATPEESATPADDPPETSPPAEAGEPATDPPANTPPQDP
jgi:hypothetical protein